MRQTIWGVRVGKKTHAFVGAFPCLGECEPWQQEQQQQQPKGK